jgi:hypothetical protein
MSAVVIVCPFKITRGEGELGVGTDVVAGVDAGSGAGCTTTAFAGAGRGLVALLVCPATLVARTATKIIVNGLVSCIRISRVQGNYCYSMI